MDDISKEIEKAQLKSGLLAGLKKIYQEVDEQAKTLDLGCERCGRCCNFAEYGQELMVSTAEAGYFGVWLKTHRPGIIAGPVEKASERLKVCPFLEDRTCTAREGRMLGCRIFFCQAQGQKKQQMETLYEVYHQRIKELHKEHNVRYDYLSWGKALEALC